jgi:hypothetical protein
MTDRPTDRAAGTIAGVLTDLHEVNTRLAARTALDAEGTALILDRLAAELAEAAAMIRRDAGIPAPDPAPALPCPAADGSAGRAGEQHPGRAARATQGHFPSVDDPAGGERHRVHGAQPGDR